MAKISRNEPCPCGSGKKYKHCCNNVVPFPLNGLSSTANSNSSAQSNLNEFKQSIQGQEYNSMEELNAELASFFQAKNNRKIDSFMGLSPNQMQEILYDKFEFINCVFDIKFDKSLFLEAPFFKQSLFFLKKIENNGFLKATQKGNLPRAFIIELFDTFFSVNYFLKPTKEADLIQASVLKHILNLSGLIKKSKSKFSLTKKGSLLLARGNELEIFETTLLCYISKFNWGFRDNYSDLNLIQKSVIFGLYMLHKKCDEWTLDSDISKIFLDAFPDLVIECDSKQYSTPEQQVLNAFSIRFLEQFCLPWGFLEEKIEGERYKDGKVFYRTTEFFRKSFSLKI